MDHSERQRIIDEEHLRLTRVGFFVSAGAAALFGCFGLLYAGMGTFVTFMSRAAGSNVKGPPPEFALFFVLFGLGFVAFGATIAALRLHAAKCIRQRKSRIFCIVMAVISCLEVPYGTVFGVLSIMVLSRQSVRDLFESHHPGPASEPAGPDAPR